MFALESLLGAGGNMVVSIYRRFAEFISGGHWWRFHSLALFPFLFSLRSNWYSHLLSKISFARCSRDWAVGCKNTLASLWSPEVKKNINILNTLTHLNFRWHSRLETIFHSRCLMTIGRPFTWHREQSHSQFSQYRCTSRKSSSIPIAASATR